MFCGVTGDVSTGYPKITAARPNTCLRTGLFVGSAQVAAAVPIARRFNNVLAKLPKVRASSRECTARKAPESLAEPGAGYPESSRSDSPPPNLCARGGRRLGVRFSALCGQSRSLQSIAADDCIFYAKRGTVQLRCLPRARTGGWISDHSRCLSVHCRTSSPAFAGLEVLQK